MIFPLPQTAVGYIGYALFLKLLVIYLNLKTNKTMQINPEVVAILKLNRLLLPHQTQAIGIKLCGS